VFSSAEVCDHVWDVKNSMQCSSDADLSLVQLPTFGNARKLCQDPAGAMSKHACLCMCQPCDGDCFAAGALSQPAAMW
jgi:hypothetical protein